jgi:DNA topoisomerase-3
MLDVSKYRVGEKIGGFSVLKESKTSPPRQFVEGDLVDIMDDIGKYAQIGRETMQVLRQKNKSGSGKAGIGTARTRGEIINKLFATEFLEKDKKGKLTPTEKGILLYTKLGQCGVAKTLISPEMTAQWEIGLEKIEQGKITLDQFMAQLLPFIEAMVTDMMASPSATARGPSKSVEKHPKDGQVCPECNKGTLFTMLVMKKESKSFGKRYVRCSDKDGCKYFGEFI